VDGDATTGGDVTPYARAYARGERGWWRMMEWVWFAGGDRIRHAALLRSSAASRRFVRINCLLLALGMTVFQLTQVGWRVSSNDEGEPVEGAGWILAASAQQGPAAEESSPTHLWWNPPQAALTGSIGLVTAIFVICVTLKLLAVFTEAAHRSDYRGQYRMTAAIHYSTAWLIPVFVGAILLGFLPLAYCGDVAGWSWHPSRKSILIAGGAVTGLGFCLGWFWLVRVSATAPVRTRTRVATFFAIGFPVIVGGAACGWHLGLMKLYEVLMPVFELDFV